MSYAIHVYSTGDIVGVFSNNKSVLPDKLLSGVVLKAIDTCVTVAFEDIPEKVNLNDFSGSLQLVKLANDVTYRRLKRCAIYIWNKFM